MNQRIHRSHKEPKREGLSWDERWKGKDKGLITCWEVGRELREKEPELASRAEKGELPVLGWKGVEKKTKKGEKYGTLFHLARLNCLLRLFGGGEVVAWNLEARSATFSQYAASELAYNRWA